MSDASDLMVWLEQDDERSRPYRAQRLRLLLEEYGPDGDRMFYGGPVSLWAFEECRRAYLHGLFLCCVLSAQACVEHMLAALFRIAGRDDLERATFERLLQEARAERYLSDEEFALFDRLRTLRNPYAHPRAPTTKGALLRRAMESDAAVDGLLAADAELAVTALLRLCRRRPFAI